MATKRQILNKLNMVQSAKLITLLAAEYVESKMTDTPFAVHATKVLGFPVDVGHVVTRRTALDIPSNGRPSKTPARPADITAMQELVSQLEARVYVLEQRILVLDKAHYQQSLKFNG